MSELDILLYQGFFIVCGAMALIFMAAIIISAMMGVPLLGMRVVEPPPPPTPWDDK